MNFMHKKLKDNWERFAVIEGNYRYHLTRDCSESPLEILEPDQTGAVPFLLAVMVNPSTADHLIDDRTVEKLMPFTLRHGYKRLEVVNLFAYRDKDLKKMFEALTPEGPENKKWLNNRAKLADKVLLAWGNEAHATPAASDFINYLELSGMSKRLYCFQRNKNASPTHPSRHMTHKSNLLAFENSHEPI
jgi:hypothetical protein